MISPFKAWLQEKIGTASKFLEAVLEENRREIIKEWIDSGRIKDIIARDK